MCTARKCVVTDEKASHATGLRVARRSLTVVVQHLPQRLAVPVLLEVPEREEGRHVGVVVGPGVQEVAQVARRVVLDVVHVAQAPQVRRRQRLPGEGGEVEVVDVEPAHDPLVLFDPEGHALSSMTGTWPDDRRQPRPEPPEPLLPLLLLPEPLLEAPPPPPLPLSEPLFEPPPPD
jgi:hypothetical protein